MENLVSEKLIVRTLEGKMSEIRWTIGPGWEYDYQKTSNKKMNEIKSENNNQNRKGGWKIRRSEWIQFIIVHSRLKQLEYF